MRLIPVIDLKHGLVVHAREGRRDEYAPVRSRLCAGAAPLEVVAALLALHPFESLYIADLDAIGRRGDHLVALAEIRRHFPALELWVDSGIADARALEAWLARGIGRAVIGSESLGEAAFMEVVRARSAHAPPVLSLDFLGDEFRGPPPLLAQPAQYWPRQVLAMNLRRVGSGAGPDVALIGRLVAAAPGCEVYAAGGIRSVHDLAQIEAAGAAGALVATALHDGRLGQAELARFASPD